MVFNATSVGASAAVAYVKRVGSALTGWLMGDTRQDRQQQQQQQVDHVRTSASTELDTSTATATSVTTSQQQRPTSAIDDIESAIFRSLESAKSPLVIERRNVSIRNDALNIWTLSAVNKTAPRHHTPIVLLHGFATGLAMWLPNIETLCESRPLHAIDMLGFGRSSRPKFSADHIVAESQFVEALEDWRKAMHLPHIILLAHCFGAYIATAYALKYPSHVVALILADPWGFSERPSSAETQASTPIPMWINAISLVYKHVSPLALFRGAASTATSVGILLLQLLRPDYKRKYMSTMEQPMCIYDYLYHINASNPTGEEAFMHMAENFGFAKSPMIRRIDRVDPSIPIWFIYGSRSWIDPASGFSSIYLRANSVHTSVKIIIGSGHTVHADKCKEFNEYVKYILGLVDEHIENKLDYPPPATAAHDHEHSHEHLLAGGDLLLPIAHAASIANGHHVQMSVENSRQTPRDDSS